MITITKLLKLSISIFLLCNLYLNYLFYKKSINEKNKKIFIYYIISIIILTLNLLILLISNNKIIDLILINISNIITIYFQISVVIKILKTSNLLNITKELNHEKMLRSSISKLTHELKNPIAVCNGYLEMLDINNKDKTIKYLDIIKNEVKRSKTIIDEFSNYGKLKKLEYEEMDISYLFEDIKNLLMPLFKFNKATLIIKSKEEIYLMGDYNKLKQVFINLLKNTLEAKKKHISLKVEVKIVDQENKVLIIITDNGIGMDKETLKKVSEVFFTTKVNGTGLGLAFSKEVIELHNGVFKINSKLDVGTSITIILPKEKKSEDFNNKN